MRPLRAFWYSHPNVGDTLTPVLLDWLRIPFVRAGARESGKFIGVGSLLATLQEGDVVWGTGCIDDVCRRVPGDVEVLACRGPLTARQLNLRVEVFGDPALLMPLVYTPTREHSGDLVGCVPHYIECDEPAWRALAAQPDHQFIDICQPWRQFIDHIHRCNRIVTSSLHAFILAEAYNIPVAWLPITNKVIGGGFKFRDYFLGTDRGEDGGAALSRLEWRQAQLLTVLDRHLRHQRSAAELP